MVVVMQAMFTQWACNVMLPIRTQMESFKVHIHRAKANVKAIFFFGHHDFMSLLNVNIKFDPCKPILECMSGLCVVNKAVKGTNKIYASEEAEGIK